MRRARTCPPGATTAIFVEGGDEERMLGRLINIDRIFVQVFKGRDSSLLRNVAEATTKDPGWPGIRSVGVILDVEGEDGDETQAAVSRSWQLVELAFKSLDWPVPGSPD